MVVREAMQMPAGEIVWREGPAGFIPRDRTPETLSGGALTAKAQAAHPGLEGLIHLEQEVFLSGGYPIGRIEAVLPGDKGWVSYLVVHTAHIWDRHKLLPVNLVSAVDTQGVQLSIDRGQFRKLIDYQIDAVLAEQVENALWNNEVLRVTGYHEFELQVEDGVVSITGYVTGMMNQERIEAAVAGIQGVLGLRTHLITDDELLLDVAAALIPVGRVEGNHVFAKVQSGVVVLSGEVISADHRLSAEKCSADVAWVRGVVNAIHAPGVDLEAEDQRFLQPAIGERIYFLDGLYGFVKQVIINPDNRRVVQMVIQGRFPEKKIVYGSGAAVDMQTPERAAVIPVRLLRYLTRQAGFLLINSTDTASYQNFTAADFSAPAAGWVPPYPYQAGQVRFAAGPIQAAEGKK